MLVNLSAAKK